MKVGFDHLFFPERHVRIRGAFFDASALASARALRVSVCVSYATHE